MKIRPFFRVIFQYIVFFQADGDLRHKIRNALINMSSAFIMNKEDEHNITMMNALLSVHIESSQSHVR